jgi:hypothetical protein
LFPSKPLLDWRARPFSKESFLEWRELETLASSAMLDSFCKQTANFTVTLLRAAARRRMTRQAIHAFTAFFEKLPLKLGLSDEIVRMLRERALFDGGRMAVNPFLDIEAVKEDPSRLWLTYYIDWLSNELDDSDSWGPGPEEQRAVNRYYTLFGPSEKDCERLKKLHETHGFIRQKGVPRGRRPKRPY